MDPEENTKQLIGNIMTVGMILINRNTLLEEELVGMLSVFDTKCTPKEPLEQLLKVLERDELYELANVIKNFIDYNYTNPYVETDRIGLTTTK